MRHYSTVQVARLIGVSKLTLLRWLYAGKVPEPKRIHVGRIANRIWTPDDLKAVRKYKTAHRRR